MVRWSHRHARNGVCICEIARKCRRRHRWLNAAKKPRQPDANTCEYRHEKPNPSCIGQIGLMYRYASTEENESPSSTGGRLGVSWRRSARARNVCDTRAGRDRWPPTHIGAGCGVPSKPVVTDENDECGFASGESMTPALRAAYSRILMSTMRADFGLATSRRNLRVFCTSSLRSLSSINLLNSESFETARRTRTLPH